MRIRALVLGAITFAMFGLAKTTYADTVIGLSNPPCNLTNNTRAYCRDSFSIYRPVGYGFHWMFAPFTTVDTGTFVCPHFVTTLHAHIIDKSDFLTGKVQALGWIKNTRPVGGGRTIWWFEQNYTVDGRQGPGDVELFNANRCWGF